MKLMHLVGFIIKKKSLSKLSILLFSFVPASTVAVWVTVGEGVDCRVSFGWLQQLNGTGSANSGAFG
jgi:hypothetical protein